MKVLYMWPYVEFLGGPSTISTTLSVVWYFLSVNAMVKLYLNIKVHVNTLKFNPGSDSFNMCIVINWYWLATCKYRSHRMTNTWGVWPFKGHCPVRWIPLRSNECITGSLWLITNRAYSKLLPQMTACVITFLISDLHLTPSITHTALI